jgi:hypothetical protein
MAQSPPNTVPIKSWLDLPHMLPDAYELRKMAIKTQDYTVYSQRFLEDALPSTPSYQTSGVVPEVPLEIPNEPEPPEWGPDEPPIIGDQSIPVEEEPENFDPHEEISES